MLYHSSVVVEPTYEVIDLYTDLRFPKNNAPRHAIMLSA